MKHQFTHSFWLGLVISIIFILFAKYVTEIFLSTTYSAYRIAAKGLPYIALEFTSFILNVSFIGYYQSVERSRMATFLSMLRGLVFLVPCFLLTPLFAKSIGLNQITSIWLTIPISEMLTLITSIVHRYFSKRKNNLHN